MLLLPGAALAQFSDLDSALANLERGFGSGDVDAITSGIAGDDQVQLQFPGLTDKSGFFGRDQAAYLLDGLFNKVNPSGFERVSARRGAEGLYNIKARWTFGGGERDLFITLRNNDNGCSLVSIRSGG